MKKLIFVFVCLSLVIPCQAETTRVVLQTNFGDIAIELFPADSPITVANFLEYVNSDFYDELIFHRVIEGFMIQGGGFDVDLYYQTPGDPIINESNNGLSNLRGTIAMARTAEPNSATSQFFINHVDNNNLDYNSPNDVGYCVFGQVTSGMNVVDAIAQVPTGDATSPNMGLMHDVPLSPVIIYNVVKTITVDDDGPSDFNSIQEAIDDPNTLDGDTIEVHPGIYYEHINFHGKAITVTCLDPNDENTVRTTIIDAGGADHVVRFQNGEDNSSALKGFTVRNGEKGIYCSQADPVIYGCIIKDNADDGVWGYLATPSITHCQINANLGSGIYDCDGVISNCIVTGNSEKGIAQCGGEVSNCTIGWNKSDGFYLDDVSASATLSGCIVVNNDGYGVKLLSGDVILLYNDIWGNSNGSYNVAIPSDANDIHSDPCFAVDGYWNGNDWVEGDYHLKSEIGRWYPYFCGSDLNDDGTVDLLDFSEFAGWWMKTGDNIPADLNGDGIVDILDLGIFADNFLSPEFTGIWVQDDVTSPCIDAADPCVPTGDEPYPNGNIVNQGAYGTTAEASKSPSGQTGYCTQDIAGDLNEDCKIDFNDFAIMASSWLEGEFAEPNFAEEWVARYNGPGDDSDRACAIVIDNADNVYVTGYSVGNVGGDDYSTIKYDPTDGNELWVVRYDGPLGSTDHAQAVAVDSSGNVYVTGNSAGAGTYFDYATVKYDPNGSELWVARYNGPDNQSDTAMAIAVDSSGGVYVTGCSKNADKIYDYVTIKYDAANGNELWVARYNGPGNGHDIAKAVAIDSFGGVYVTGYSKGSGTGDDYATIKYDPANGNELWVARYNGPGNGSDKAYAIAIDSGGNIYVTGSSANSSDDYATIKYNADGNELWVARYDGPSNGADYAHAIAIDNSNNVYVTGYCQAVGGDDDYATIKYDPNGNELWASAYNGTGEDSDQAYAVIADSFGNVYVTGSSKGIGGNYDYATIKYDADDGNEIDAARYNGPGDGSDNACAMAIDSASDIYVTGYGIGSGTGSDYTTIKYSPFASGCAYEVIGDINGDCKVDFKDLVVMTEHWLECNLDPPETCWD